MSVPVGVARTRNIGSGSAGPFAFNFVLYSAADLKVVKTSLAGADTVLTLTTDYSVTVATDFSSATVTLVTPLAGTGIDNGTSEILTITRDPIIQQPTKWPRNDPFPSATHEKAADLAVMMIGRLSEQLGRSLLLPESSTASGLKLPNPQALKFLRWNATADALENMDVASPGVLVVSPFIQTLLDDTTAAAARTTLAAAGYPGASVASRIATWSGTAGKDLLDGGATIADIDPRGKQSIWIPATALYTVTGAAGPSAGQLNVGGAIVNYLAFDAATDEFAYFTIATPKSWNAGTLSAEFFWLHPATTTNFGVVWSAGLGSFADNIAIANVYTTQTITDTGGVTNNMYRSPETAAIDPGNAQAKQDILLGFASRNAANGADTLAVDAFLIGVMLHYTTNASTDA